MMIRGAAWRHKALLLTASPAAEVLTDIGVLIIFYFSSWFSHPFFFVDELRLKSLRFLMWSLCADDQLAKKAKQNSPWGCLVVWRWHPHALGWDHVRLVQGDRSCCRWLHRECCTRSVGLDTRAMSAFPLRARPADSPAATALGAWIETLLQSVCS